MADQKPNIKRRVWNLLRWGIVLFAVAMVVRNVTWRDQLLVPAEGEVKLRAVSGWAERGPDGKEVFHALDGKTYPIPAEEREKVLIPGFRSLIWGLDVRLLLAAFALYPVTSFLLAWRWQLLLRTHNLDPGYPEALRLNWIGLFMNLVFPGSSGGDLVKAVCIYRRTPNKRLAAVMTVFIDRVVGLISLMLIGTIAIFLQSDIDELSEASRTTSWVLPAILGGGLIFFSGRLRKLLRVAEIVERLPFSSKIKQMDDSIFHYRNHIPLLFCNVAISFVIHISTVISVYWLGRSLDLTVPLIYYFAALPVIFTAGAVIPAPGGLGVLEWLFQLFFTNHGASASSAVALCILYRLMMIVAAMPGAVFAYRESSMGGVPIINTPEMDESSLAME